MGKKTKKKDHNKECYGENIERDLSPETIAELYWKDFNAILANKTYALLDSNKRKFIDDFLKKRNALDDGTTKGSIASSIHSYKLLVRPYLPWDKINNSLEDINISDIKKEQLLFTLKPIAMESFFDLDSNPLFKILNEIEQTIFNRCNWRIKKISPLIKQLDELQKVPEYKYIQPLFEANEFLKREVSELKEIVKFGKKRIKDYLSSLGIGKTLKKSPQKHKFWNISVSKAIKIINSYYHTDDCAGNCKKTHQKAYFQSRI